MYVFAMLSRGSAHQKAYSAFVITQIIDETSVSRQSKGRSLFGSALSLIYLQNSLRTSMYFTISSTAPSKPSTPLLMEMS